MSLPLSQPFFPMEAKSAAKIPIGPEWQYEPKWDGFRCIVFRDSDSVVLQSKAGKPLTRYFPEIVEAMGKVKAKQFVLDGELIVPRDGQLSFDDLLQRIHPAASRVAKLAAETPAQLVVFDLLVDAKGTSVAEENLSVRRNALEAFYRKFLVDNDRVLLSRATPDLPAARKWLNELRGQLDGIIAKRVDRPYESGERAMQKIKNIRTADCVVGGFRYGTDSKEVGSLLLGLYHKGVLDHVGFTSSIAAASRASLTKKLETLIEPPGFTGAAPGGPSRWSTDRSTEWQPLKPVLVAEVQFDHFTGGRFRHGTKFMRWRPDKDPKQCTVKQVQSDAAVPLGLLTVAANHSKPR
jgi:ATP-dependent DNA ligase